jgi:hypothetical protein
VVTVAGTETTNHYISTTKTITNIQAYQLKQSCDQLAELTVEHYVDSTPFTFCPNNIFFQQSFLMLLPSPYQSSKGSPGTILPVSLIFATQYSKDHPKY